MIWKGHSIEYESTANRKSIFNPRLGVANCSHRRRPSICPTDWSDVWFAAANSDRQPITVAIQSPRKPTPWSITDWKPYERGGSWASEPIEPPLVCAVRYATQRQPGKCNVQPAVRCFIRDTLSVSSYLNCTRRPAAPTRTRLFIVDAGVNEQRTRPRVSGAGGRSRARNIFRCLWLCDASRYRRDERGEFPKGVSNWLGQLVQNFR